MSHDRADLHRETDVATDHPKAFAEAILDYTPTISKFGNQLVIVFDEPDQVTEVHDMLWAAINSVKPASTTKEGP